MTKGIGALLKANIKSMLISVLVLGLFGSLYAFLSSQPEMVADNNLRVEEPSLEPPSLASKRAEFDESKFPGNPFLKDEGMAVSVEQLPVEDSIIESAEVEQVAGVTSEAGVELVSLEVAPEVPETIGEQAVVTADSEQNNVKETDELQDEKLAEAAEVEELAAREMVVDTLAEKKADVELVEVDEVQLVDVPSTTDVSVIADVDDFIDLNLVGDAPLEMVLLEGDELILDDVNEGLSKFGALIDKSIAKSPVDLSVDEVSEASDETVIQKSPVIATVMIPDADKALMTGTDKVSLEYQATMAKLVEVKQQVAEADAENSRLKEKFSSVVNQNRELAILIRDIDVQIKTLTAAN